MDSQETRATRSGHERGDEPVTREPSNSAGEITSNGGFWRRVLDWAELLKLRLASLVVLGAFVGALLGMSELHGVMHAIEAAFWIACSAASGCALNQVLEQEVDSRMERTRGRPLLTGRIGVRDAVLVAAALGAAATLGLALRFNLLSSFLSLGALFTYVAVYTPLKKVSALNTLVGAFPGAAPVAIGYAAMTGDLGSWAISLFLIVFAWQFPHFMAIAWIYREDYRRAGLLMVPVLKGGERAAGLQALGHSIVLIPISLLPVLWGDVGTIYLFGTLVASVLFTVFAGRFALVQDESRAHALFYASLAYLPALFALIYLDQLLGGGTLS
jgi:protoheme IX farnesyltransferase